MNEQKLNGIYDQIYAVEERMKFVEENSIAGLRDFFATSALSCLSNPAVAAGWGTKEVAKFAYDVAEAMMEERKKRNVS